MKKETAKKRITNVVEKELKGETKEVKDYVANIIMLTFQNLELDYGACHDDGTPYTSTENLNYAIDSVLHDGDLGMILDEAKREITR